MESLNSRKRLKWGGRWGSNPRQRESQSRALPTELRPPQTAKYQPDYITSHWHTEMVRPAGLEPATLGLEGRCSIQVSYGRKSFNGYIYIRV